MSTASAAKASKSEAEQILQKARDEGYLVGKNPDLLRFKHGKYTLYASPRWAGEVFYFNAKCQAVVLGYISYSTKAEMCETFDKSLAFYRDQLIAEHGGDVAAADKQLASHDEQAYIREFIAKGF